MNPTLQKWQDSKIAGANYISLFKDTVAETLTAYYNDAEVLQANVTTLPMGVGVGTNLDGALSFEFAIADLPAVLGLMPDFPFSIQGA